MKVQEKESGKAKEHGKCIDGKKKENRARHGPSAVSGWTHRPCCIDAQRVRRFEGPVDGLPPGGLAAGSRGVAVAATSVSAAVSSRRSSSRATAV